MADRLTRLAGDTEKPLGTTPDPADGTTPYFSWKVRHLVIAFSCAAIDIALMILHHIKRLFHAGKTFEMGPGKSCVIDGTAKLSKESPKSEFLYPVSVLLSLSLEGVRLNVGNVQLIPEAPVLP